MPFAPTMPQLYFGILPNYIPWFQLITYDDYWLWMWNHNSYGLLLHDVISVSVNIWRDFDIPPFLLDFPSRLHISTVPQFTPTWIFISSPVISLFLSIKFMNQLLGTNKHTEHCQSVTSSSILIHKYYKYNYNIVTANTL